MNKSRYLLYGLGIIILTLGIALTILSDLGTSPFDAMLVGLTKTIGFTVGSWEIVIAIIIIFCNSIFKSNKPEYLGLATAFITGLSIDLWLFLLEQLIQPDIFFSKLIYFGIGLILIGIGSAIYLITNFAPIPVDQSMLIIRDLLKVNIMFSKTIIYVIFLILAFMFKGPIGIGTVLTVCLGGPILNFCMPSIERWVNKKLMKKSNTVENSHSI